MMPVQYPYPETGWSTGRMRKMGEAVGGEANVGEAAGAMANSPVIDTIERMHEARKKGMEPKYETKLNKAEEAAFQVWKQQYAPKDSGQDYDLRGAFRAGLKPDPETGHWPDTYKKPSHPTFSDQSIYARERPDLAGRWEGDNYIPPGPAGAAGGG